MLAESGLIALLAITALTAALWGGWRERAGVAMLIAVSAATLLLPADPRLGPYVLTLLMTDVAVTVVLGWMAWKAPSPWPVWMLAPQAVAAAASLAFTLQPDVSADVYLRGLLITRYAAALVLLIGIRRSSTAQP